MTNTGKKAMEDKLKQRQAKAAEAKDKSFVQEVVENSIQEVEKEELTQRSYYLTDELLQAITMKTLDKEFDKSRVVRAALEEFLKDELAYIRSKKNKVHKM